MFSNVSARLLEVIEVDSLRGKGTTEEPYRRVKAYFSKDGELLGGQEDCFFAEVPHSALAAAKDIHDLIPSIMEALPEDAEIRDILQEAQRASEARFVPHV